MQILDYGEYINMGENMRKKLIVMGLLLNIFLGAYADKQVNVRVSPSVLFGVLNAKVDIKVAKNIAVGPIVDYAIWLLDYYSLGLGANLHLSGKDIMQSDGWYLNPYATYADGRFKFDASSAKLSNKTVGLILGHQWIAKSGFNFRIGFGVQHNSSKIFASNGDDEASVFSGNIVPDFSMTFGQVF